MIVNCNSEDSNLTIREYLDYLFNSPEPKIVKYVSESDSDSDNGPKTIEETETTVILESDFSCTPPSTTPLPCQTYAETDLDVDLHIVGQGNNMKLKEAKKIFIGPLVWKCSTNNFELLLNEN